MSGLLEGKVAVVTGGGNGIGRASSMSFAREGASVMVCDINEGAGKAVVEEIRAAGGTAEFMACDVTKEDEVAALIKGTVDAFGRLDCAHNNAGNQFGNPGFGDTTVEAWHKTVDLTMMGIWLCMRAELPVMEKQGGGTIVNTTSMAGVRSNVLSNAAYSAAKRGVISLTEFAAIEYAGKGIRVNTIAPGLVKTAIVQQIYTPEQQDEFAARDQPIGRIIDPQEIADGVIYLSSDKSAMVTGVTLPIAGGYNAT